MTEPTGDAKLLLTEQQQEMIEAALMKKLASKTIAFSSDYDDPYYVSSHDFAHPARDVVSEPLNSINYHAWSRSILRALEARNKVGFIDGTIKSPTATDPRFSSWKRLNSMLISWLLTGCDPKISSVGTMATTAHIFWVELRKKYFPKNGTRLLELKRELLNTKQGDLTVLDYYNKLEVIWRELEHIRKPVSCSCGNQSMIEFQEEEFVLQFLVGLDDIYTTIRSHISMMVPLPPKEEAYNMVSNAEKLRDITQPSYQSTTLYTSSTTHKHAAGTYKGKKGKATSSDMYCTHCRMTNHNIDSCYFATGKYPEGWKFSDSGKKPRKVATVNCAEFTALPEQNSQNLHEARLQCHQLMQALGISGSLQSDQQHQPSTPLISSVTGPQHFEDSWTWQPK